MENIIKVLAVDDEKFNLLLLQSCLKNEKYLLKTCSNAIEALNEFKKEDFDVVLLDIIMVGIDGFEVRKLIREINRDIPIIFLTSMVDDINSTLLNRIVDDKCSYYMNKSFNKKTLMKKIDQAVSVYRDHRESNLYYHKLEEDLTLAGDVQNIMLPRWCELWDQMVSSHLYVPRMKVSGDIIETIKIDDNRMLSFIGDIAGHGVQAALYMSAIISFLKVLLLEKENLELAPHVILNRIEKFFRNDLGGKNYMTCIVSIFDFSRNHLSFQSAGHPGIICCSPKTGSAWHIDVGSSGGVPVGLVRQNEFKPEDTVEYDFEEDTIFMTYTDGILDLSNAADDTIEDEIFLSLLGTLAKESDTVAIPFRLYNALQQIGYNVSLDDICLNVIQKRLDRPLEIIRTVSADTTEVSRMTADFGTFVKEKTACDKLATKVELLLSEFLNNVILHGLETRKHTQMDIYVRIVVSPKEITIRTLDQGKEWNYEPTFGSSEEFLERKNADRATSGRGMAIIYSIVSSISRSHYCGLNQTIFTIAR